MANENSMPGVRPFPPSQQLAHQLHEANGGKIVLLVADGLGGLPLTPGGLTELETANKPHLDRFAQQGVCGRIVHVAPGVTPGSGPGHLALFGYDPRCSTTRWPPSSGWIAACHACSI